DGGAISWWTLPEALDLRVIERTEPIPGDAIVAGAALDPATRASVTRFFLQAHTEPSLRDHFDERRIERYVQANPAVYEPLQRELQREQQREPPKEVRRAAPPSP